ncbi:MAG: EAL domain-containing protein, partial [Actinomycetota bacterium]
DRVAAGRLVIEVTESVVIDSDPVVTSNLELAVDLGVRLAMDDFGTGYSSLTNLKRHPFSVVKVDRDFVDGLGTRPADHAIVEAVVGMAHALGMRIVAEGIEQDIQMALLAELGADCGQGFGIGRPVPLGELAPPAPAEPALSGGF